jgi:hypothetical protein
LLGAGVGNRQQVHGAGQPLGYALFTEPGPDAKAPTLEGKLSDVATGLPTTPRVSVDDPVVLDIGLAEADYVLVGA